MRECSFADIVQWNDPSKRNTVRISDDNLVNAVDLVMTTLGKNRNESNEVLRDLKQSVFDKEKFIVRSRGRWLTFEDAIELIMVLPGKPAKHVRKQCANIIVRYLDGDRTMCIEVEENKAMGKIKSYSKFASKIKKQIHEDKANQLLEMPQTCYIYATKSAAFPGLVKIGKTEDVSRRVSQLNTACAPAPHVIVAVAPTFDNDRDEKTAHAFFSKARRAGEFFEITDAEVMAYFTMHITSQYNTELTQNISSLQGMHV
jgi:hypothetical protein